MVANSEMISYQSVQKQQEEYFSPLSRKYLEELETLELHYPGWEKDYTAAKEHFQEGSEVNFVKILRKAKDKQRVYDDYKAFKRLNALAAVELSYPGHEFDKQVVEQWHLEHPSNDETDMVFEDKLDGLRNKEKLYYGDRSHPNIRDLDALDLNYPGWEDDYQAAISAHCDTPSRSFANALHRLRQKQCLHEGDRSHWRLVALDKLKLTYPGWQTDVSEVEEWHLNSAENPKNEQLYAEVIEGMKDQQQIYLGWDHEDDAEDADDESSDDLISSAESSSRSAGGSIERERAKLKQMIQCYASIAENLNSMEGKKKELMEKRSSSFSNPPSRSATPEPAQQRSASPSRRDPPPKTKASSGGKVTVSMPQFLMKTEANGSRPPKQVNLGKCEVCLTRPKTHVFVPCGHLCACAACSHQAMQETNMCPICRRKAESSYRVFLT